MLHAGKPLHVYAGKEVARALAKSSLDPADVGSSVLHDLGAEDMSRLHEAVARYDNQFDAVGQVRNMPQISATIALSDQCLSVGSGIGLQVRVRLPGRAGAVDGS